jgi:hypothetical protein
MNWNFFIVYLLTTFKTAKNRYETFLAASKLNPVDEILNEARPNLTPRLFCTFLRSLNQRWEINDVMMENWWSHISKCWINDGDLITDHGW